MVLSLEKQVISLDLAKQLKELGRKQDSLWWWVNIDAMKTPQRVIYDKIVPEIETGNNNEPICSAYTTSELGEMLKDYISLRETYTNKIGWRIHAEKYAHFCTADTEVNARGLMLKWLIENKKIVL